jgi:hypothetical protein
MSETATESTEQQPATKQAPAPTETETSETSETATAEERDWQAEAEKWKALARKHEGNAKTNADKARQFDEFQESQKSELEKLQDRATKAEEAAQERAAEMALLKAGVQHGLSEDDLALVGTHGSPEDIAERAERLASRLKASAPKTDFGGGDRGEDVGSKVKQMTESELSALYAERRYSEIEQARQEGRLADLLGG